MNCLSHTLVTTTALTSNPTKAYVTRNSIGAATWGISVQRAIK